MKSNKDLVTVIYYTSNKEDEVFENKIRNKLLESIGDLPLISVSQKPINFGKNICVGNVGVSNQNAHRQFQIGAKEAKTPFVIAAEADCLYPKEYFEFIPPVLNRAYRCNSLYILFSTGGFRKKEFSECATVVGREYIINEIEKSLSGRGMWQDVLEHGSKVPVTFRKRNFESFVLNVPIINIKTENGMHAHAKVSKFPTKELPFWGSADDLRKKYL